jgi:G:T-mismatch repair DNA endonuclease (very short patch repair protein)
MKLTKIIQYNSGEVKHWMLNTSPDDPRRIKHRNSCRKARPDSFIEKCRERRAQQTFPLKDSTPERVLQTTLKLFGVTYRKHKTLKNLLPEYYDTIKATVSGSVRQHQFDIILDGLKLIVEADGCWWHSCKVCGQETKYYSQKENLIRDTAVNKLFENGTFYGWKLIRIYEHELGTIGDAIIAVETKIPNLLNWPKDDFVTIPDKVEEEKPEDSSIEELPIEEDLDFGVEA